MILFQRHAEAFFQKTYLHFNAVNFLYLDFFPTEAIVIS